jgi:diaminopimelate decarboxylase
MTLDRALLLDVANKFGTPLFVYDADMILARYKELYAYIQYPRLRIHYAMKANYNFHILQLLNEAGAALDTVSPGEVLLALRAGFSPDRIIYTANNMTAGEIDEVAKCGVLMNIGSLSELEKFGQKYPDCDLCIRFNPDVVDGEHVNMMTGGDLTKFGILLKDVDKVIEIVNKYHLKVIGLHEHTGSGLQHAESVFQSMKNLIAIADKDNFPHLKFLDFGGGFKVPYKPDENRIDYVAMGAEISRLFTEFCNSRGQQLDMYFEPGKYIVAEAGCLLVKIVAIKNNNGRLIAGCNSGFPQLIRPVFYGAYHQITNLSNPDGNPAVYDVCGNICETGDRFAEQRSIPEIREGDVLAIHNAGAYCYSMGGVYNLRPMPGEVLVRDGAAKLVRKKLSNADLVKQIIEESSL